MTVRNRLSHHWWHEHTLPTPTYAGYRFSAEIISHAVWMYFRFLLSFRDVEELMTGRGISVTYETIRQWCQKSGQRYANQLRRRQAKMGDKWHLGQVFLSITGCLRNRQEPLGNLTIDNWDASDVKYQMMSA